MNINMKNSSSNRFIINGKTYSGNSATINGDKVIIDGVEQCIEDSKNINVTIHGDVSSIDLAAGKVNVTGSAEEIKTQSGDIKCGNVSGSAKTMSGDIKCGSVGGNASTMSGDIIRK